MDIAAFISELLAQRNALVVPGLGTFSKNRVDGYYNREQQAFFPPSLQIQFKNEFTDDAVLANLIASQRQISLASAKYFIEKFVSGIKDQASVGTVAFGNMGTFSTRRSGLTFTPNELNETDELFYGLAPVKLRRNSSFRQPVAPPTPPPIQAPAPVAEPEPRVAVVPVEPEPITVAEVPQDIETETQEEYVEEEDNGPHRGVNVWLVVALIIVLTGLGIVGVYLYKPNYLKGLKPLIDKFKHSAPVVPKKSKEDSLKQAQQAQKDIGLAPVSPAIKAKTDSLKQLDTIRIVASSFKTLKVAKEDSTAKAKNGLSPEIHRDPSGKRYQVTIGTYFNTDSANNALPILKQKLKKTDVITIQTYPYKKQ